MLISSELSRGREWFFPSFFVRPSLRSSDKGLAHFVYHAYIIFDLDFFEQDEEKPIKHNVYQNYKLSTQMIFYEYSEALYHQQTCSVKRRLLSKYNHLLTFLLYCLSLLPVLFIITTSTVYHYYQYYFIIMFDTF